MNYLKKVTLDTLCNWHCPYRYTSLEPSRLIGIWCQEAKNSSQKYLSLLEDSVGQRGCIFPQEAELSAILYLLRSGQRRVAYHVHCTKAQASSGNKIWSTSRLGLSSTTVLSQGEMDFVAPLKAPFFQIYLPGEAYFKILHQGFYSVASVVAKALSGCLGEHCSLTLRWFTEFEWQCNLETFHHPLAATERHL